VWLVSDAPVALSEDGLVMEYALKWWDLSHSNCAGKSWGRRVRNGCTKREIESF